ncbi:hypothetical protein KUV28_09695 [Ferrimonas balearica]|nr:hypothetical protein [Ferrimonas balearica]
MSTPIFDRLRAGRGRSRAARALTAAARPWRAAFLLPLCLVLSGCLETAGTPSAGFRQVEEQGRGGGFFASMRRPVGPVLVTAATAAGDVVIRGPEDYCIEGRSLKTRARGGFALLARCDILSGGEMGDPVALALLTATVTPYEGAELPPARQLAADFAEMDVLEVMDRDGVRLLHLGKGGNARVPAADPRQWRATFLLNGYAVSLAAYGPKDSSVAGAAGRPILLAMARAIRAASPDRPGGQDPAAEAATDGAELAAQEPEGLGTTLNAPD